MEAPNAEIFGFAMKLLARRDLTVRQLRDRLEAQFGHAPDDVLSLIEKRKFIDDRRYAENYIARRLHRGPVILRALLSERGVPESIIDSVFERQRWPTLDEALADRVKRWKISPPVGGAEAGRLFRSLCSLGFDEDDVRLRLERLNEQ